MTRQIVAFQPNQSQPPVPLRARPDRLRALVQFPAIVTWICSAVLQHRGEPVSALHLDDVPAALRDQVSEEALRTLAVLDPLAEKTARHRARQLAGDLLANMALRASTGVIDLTDAAVVNDYGNRIADAVLERYRSQLVYGPANAPVHEVKN
jgi:hypothetical protein